MRALIQAAVAAGISLCMTPAALAADADIQAFAQQMADKHQFDADMVSQVLATANKNQKVLDAIARPWEAKPWHQYFPIFLTDKRLNEGVAFYQTHQKTLQKAEQATGVPAHIIVAILGVETFYGRIKGNYPVLDALYTLGFYYPPRADFFRSELEQYFLLSREEGFDMHALQGSYAGAMGWGQFISSSYRHYAIDFDNDGVRDLLNNPVDAIGSVANYFKQHGWQAGEPVAYPAQADGAKVKDLLEKPLKYRHTWQQLNAAGVTLAGDVQLDADASAKLFAFEQPEHHEYWVGLKNFYVITRYNHSPLYAMAVYQLSEQIRAQVNAG